MHSAVTDILAGVDTKALTTTGIILAVVGALIALAVVIGVIVGKGMTSTGRWIAYLPASIMYGQARLPKRHQSPDIMQTGQIFEGGATWVGEDGPEPVILPRGSRIISNRDARSLTGDTYNITVKCQGRRYRQRTQTDKPGQTGKTGNAYGDGEDIKWQQRQ